MCGNGCWVWDGISFLVLFTLDSVEITLLLWSAVILGMFVCNFSSDIFNRDLLERSKRATALHFLFTRSQEGRLSGHKGPENCS